MARYIDADKIEFHFLPLAVIAPDMYTTRSEINAIPTADVAEVKHGRNLSNTPSYFVCSLCGDNCCDVYTYEPSQFNYCPNCGAKMDAEEIKIEENKYGGNK